MRYKSPKYLFDKGIKISSILKTAKNGIILFLDYDGTLVPIKRIPSLAVLPQDMFDLLDRLCRKSKIRLVIVTGREHSDIKNLLPVRNIMIVSNHGFRISDKSIKWIHPELKIILPSLKKIYGLLNIILKDISGILIENKKLTLSVHFRNVANSLVPGIRKIINEIVQKFPDKLILTKGKKVIEVRPNIDWNKGKAVLKVLDLIQNNINKKSIIYIGDDKTDEDAFGILKKCAVTIRVGSSKYSLANYYVKDTAEVQIFLNKIDMINN
jgi:trehalose 6-phosphate phosphatase